MNSTLNKIVMFTIGAVIGSAVTWKLLKTKYERLAQEEIDSVKERYTYKKEEPAEAVDIPEKEPTREERHAKIAEVKEYLSMVEKNGYTNYSKLEETTAPEETEREEERNVMIPYVIAPEDFGEGNDYECISLVHFSDGVLTDDWDNPIEDVEGMVGLDYYTHFGEYEDDSVYIRNDAMKCDFEILADNRKFSDVKRSKQTE